MTAVPGLIYMTSTDRVLWKAKGRPSLGDAGTGPVDRSQLTVEVDRPVPGVNCGVYTPGEVPRGSDIIPAGEGQYVMSNGQTLANVDVYGTLKVPSNCTVDNVRVFGSPPDANPGTDDHKPLIEIPSGSTNITIKDSTLQPQAGYESDQVYGIKGRGFTLLRSVVARCVDSMQIWAGDATIQQSWFGDCYLRSPDRTRSDGDATHNDVGGQLQGGNGTITYQGNVIDATIPDYNGWFATAIDPSLFGILVTDDVKVNDIRTAPDVVRLYGNWMRGGSYPLNVSTGAVQVETNGWQEVTVLRNRIEKGYQFVSGEYWHAIASTTLVQPYWTFATSGPDANLDVVVAGTGAEQTWTPTGNPIRIKAG